MTRPPPCCITRDCLHFTGMEDDLTTGGLRYTCRAFPNGIPVDIAYGDRQHEVPLPEQEGDYVLTPGPCDLEKSGPATLRES